MEIRTSDLAAAVGGRLVGPDVVVDGATHDSRAVRAGQLFVPVVAERDGHDFIEAALEAGAGAYLTSMRHEGGTAIEVADTLEALTAAGAHARSLLPDRVVGVTGSVGKTSVKDLLASALAPRWATASSQRSFNNELGVPLTLLEAPTGTEAVVVEMGARSTGHIAALCRVARPTVGIVTRVAAAHLEVFGTIDDVALAKGELIEALPPDGTAVLNAEDERVVAMASRSAAPVLTFGAGGDVQATDLRLDDELRPRFGITTPWGSAADVQLAVRGRHQATNALAAAAAALSCGVELDQVVAGLSAAQLSPWRMDLRRAANGVVVVNDSYNANPTSMEAALRALVEIPAATHVALLGAMAELGDSSLADHAATAALAAELGVRVVQFQTEHYGPGPTAWTMREAAELLGDLGGGAALLVKGSRVAGLDEVAAHLLDVVFSS
ncbi:MAG: UDP-N-acetylmuramoyl-tripeptide--D-alanyl-D-alanine ligase [Actinomycetota bacterium]|nr:UDP-N-acetylmuramoyl-tripeptide--D-alanyl-D-alanine ligase [Actinomycetota bacterium]